MTSSPCYFVCRVCEEGQPECGRTSTTLTALRMHQEIQQGNAREANKPAQAVVCNVRTFCLSVCSKITTCKIHMRQSYKRLLSS